MNKKILILLVIVVFIWVGVFIVKNENKKLDNKGDNKIDLVSSYIQENISTISPQKEVLGGKFYVTNLQLADNKGMVEYEDGHIVVKAVFDYSVNKDNKVDISNFTILPQEDVKKNDMIDSFDKCRDVGYPIMESYPMQCKTPDGKTFVDK